MRKTIIMTALALTTLTALAKVNNDTIYVTTTPPMHCTSCEEKIKGNLRFEKGVKDIATNIPSQKVTVVFNPKKTDKQKLLKSFSKFGYTAREVGRDEKVAPQVTDGGCDNM